MIGLLASIFGIALVDSLNPSAIVVTVGLLGRDGYVSRVAAYLGAVFGTYFGLGVVLMLGLDAVSGWLDGPVAYAAQGAIGAALLVYAAFGAIRGKEERTPRQPRAWGLGAMAALGVTVTVVEFSTALPYLGAIGLMTGADLPAPQWLPILVVYNAIFVLPPVLAVAAYRRYGERARPVFDRVRRWLSGSRSDWLWISAIVGFVLLWNSLASFDLLGFLGE